MYSFIFERLITQLCTLAPARAVRFDLIAVGTSTQRVITGLCTLILVLAKLQMVWCPATNSNSTGKSIRKP